MAKRINLKTAMAELEVSDEIINGLKHSNAALRGVITKESKKNAETKELAMLLEWAKEEQLYIEIYRDGTVFVQDCDEDEIATSKSLLLALRKAKEIMKLAERK